MLGSTWVSMGLFGSGTKDLYVKVQFYSVGGTIVAFFGNVFSKSGANWIGIAHKIS